MISILKHKRNYIKHNIHNNNNNNNNNNSNNNNIVNINSSRYKHNTTIGKKYRHDHTIIKSKITIIEDNNQDDDEINDGEINDGEINDGEINDEIDDNIFNLSKLEYIHDIVNIPESDSKFSFMNNANVLRNMMVKTIDKYKIDMCNRMASQMVELYNGSDPSET